MHITNTTLVCHRSGNKKFLLQSFIDDEKMKDSHIALLLLRTYFLRSQISEYLT
jgi:hypothetical protein